MLSLCRVTLDEEKNLFTKSRCNQILRNAQDDTLIGDFYFDTATYYITMGTTIT